MEPFVQFFGRLHPMLLHAPIGLLIGLLALEALAALRRKPLTPEVRTPLAWLVAISAAGTAGTGFVLGRSGDFAGDLVDWHRIFGIAGAILCVIAAAAQQRLGARRVYFGTLAAAALAMVIAGHKGAGITHGEDYLFAPFAPARLPVVAPPDSSENAAGDRAPGGLVPSGFVRVVQPILETKCYSCHGADKKKGGLALHTPEGIARGGDFGPVVIAGNSGASEIVRRMRLDKSDDDHMPPESKPQPSDAEIKAIEAWIDAGATMEAATSTDGGGGVQAPPRLESTLAAAQPASTVPKPPNGAALKALRDKLVHAAPIAQGSNLLAVDLSVAPEISETDAIALLTPLRESIAELGAGRLRVGDSLAALAAQMPHLRRFDLSGTDVTDAGVASLSRHAELEDLMLTRTRLGAGAAEAIALMPSLKRVYLWNAGLSADAAQRLRAMKPELRVDLGEIAAAEAIEQETEVKLSSEAPLPGAAAGGGVDALKPVNVSCPVLGAPINPAFAVVHKGKVVGFCCRQCVGQFLEDPSKFEAKIQ